MSTIYYKHRNPFVLTETVLCSVENCNVSDVTTITNTFTTAVITELQTKKETKKDKINNLRKLSSSDRKKARWC